MTQERKTLGIKSGEWGVGKEGNSKLHIYEESLWRFTSFSATQKYERERVCVIHYMYVYHIHLYVYECMYNNSLGFYFLSPVTEDLLSPFKSPK